jgi:transcriptional regulator with XRE-family HTH domain
MNLTSHIARSSPTGIHRTFVNDTSARKAQNASMSRKSTKAAANHLRAWREMRGLSQEALAQRVGTAGNVIGLLESGERGLSDKWLRKLAVALDTTAGFLLDHDPNDIDAAFVEAAMAVPKEQRRQALKILETFRPTGTDG